MTNRLNVARMLRLCLKELRESLRDRRTIVTLVLMPLLVYPLLSLVLNRVLLSSMQSNEAEVLRIGVSARLNSSPLPILLGLGYGISLEETLSPTFVHPPIPDQRDKSESSELRARPEPKPELILLQDDGRNALRAGGVDVVILEKRRNDSSIEDQLDAQESEPASSAAEEEGDGDSSSVSSPRSEAVSSQSNEALAEVLTNFASNSRGIDRAKLEEVFQALGTYEVRYRHSDPRSERALQILERIFASVNSITAQTMSEGRFQSPVQLSATPIAMRSDYADLLATMVPLVLVLMTMAGAVYPAIDLTAGERERGTMEALIVSPTPTYVILLAKYSAVVTVALLTALANLGAMTLTLYVSGIGSMVFGPGVLSAGMIGIILVLLVLFTMFFAALLLAVTSFSKSFKEAQAYLIPLMLFALTPGVMSLLPGTKFSTLLATIPLVNIVLLAREVLLGSAQWEAAMTAVSCNFIYAVAAIAVASRLFGSDASMHGSQGAWRDLYSRPKKKQLLPTIDQMAITMAAMFPCYFVVSSLLPSVIPSVSVGLIASAAISYVLILGLPVFVVLFRNVSFYNSFRLGLPAVRSSVLLSISLVLIAGSAWMFAHEILILTQQLNFGTISAEQFQKVSVFQEKLKSIPLSLILFCLAFTPAITEEFLFRGFVQSSLRRDSAVKAIAISTILFASMHVLTSNVLAVERFFPTAFIGLILGWIAFKTQSIWPGVVVHALHNGFLLTLGIYEDRVKELGILVEEREHLPLTWLLLGGMALFVGLVAIHIVAKKRSEDGVSQLPAEETSIAASKLQPVNVD